MPGDMHLVRNELRALRDNVSLSEPPDATAFQNLVRITFELADVVDELSDKVADLRRRLPR